MANIKEFLTFQLGAEEYAIEILRVQEIRGWEEPSPLPQVPEYVKGVVDLRGVVVPIIDLRQRFKLPQSYDGTTVVIVVNVSTAAGSRVIGLVVDAVSDVQSMDMDELQAAPEISNTVDSQYIRGLSTLKAASSVTNQHNQNDRTLDDGDSKMVIILDIDLIATEGLLEDLTANQNN